MRAVTARARSAGRRLSLLGLAWAVPVTAIWWWRHPPRMAEFGRELGAALAVAGGAGAGSVVRALAVDLKALAVFLLVQAGGWFAGGEILALARFRPRLEPIRLLAGWSLTGVLLFGLGACGIFRLPVLAVVAALGAVAGGPDAVAAVRRGVRVWRKDRARLGPAGRAAALAAGGGLGLCTVLAMAPETGIDSLIYHLPPVARLLALGSLVPMPGNSLAHISAHAELLRGLAQALGDEPAGRFFGPAAAGLTVLMLVRLVGEAAGPAWGWSAAALFAVNVFTVAYARSSKPDMLLAAFGLGICSLFHGAARRFGTGRGVMLGILLGTATAIKLSAGELALVAVLGVAAWRARSRGALPAVLAVAALPVAPWLLKSWVLAGNPIFPFGYGVLGGVGMTPDNYHRLIGDMATLTHPVSLVRPLERLAAPWSLTVVEGAPVIWCALLPMALLDPGADARFRGWRVLVAGFLACWMTGPIQFRYLAPVLPAILVLGFRSLAGLPGRRGPALAAVLLVGQALQVLALPGLAGDVLAGLGGEPRSANFRRNLPPYADVLDELRTLPPHARVLSIGSDYGYPLIRPRLVPSRWDVNAVYPLLRASRDPDELWRRMRQLGVTFVLYDPIAAIFRRSYQAVFPWSARNMAVWEGLWRAHAREVYRSPRMSERHGWFIVYALQPHPRSPPSLAFLPGTEGVLATVEADVREQGLAAGMRNFGMLMPIAGSYGAFRYFHARMLRKSRPREALAEIRAAHASGYRDPSMDEDEVELAGRLGLPSVAARARAAQAAGDQP